MAHLLQGPVNGPFTTTRRRFSHGALCLTRTRPSRGDQHLAVFGKGKPLRGLPREEQNFENWSKLSWSMAMVLAAASAFYFCHATWNKKLLGLDTSWTNRSARADLVVLISSTFFMSCWYVSNVSIIFDAPCLFLHHLLSVSLHFVAFLCIFRN
jgi:hypothetical protein